MIQLLPLIVVVPLLAAPICMFLPGRRLPWLWATAATATSLVLAILMLTPVLQGGPISYELGGWAPPWGIELRLDTLNALVALIVTGIGTVVLFWSGPVVKYEIPGRNKRLYYTASLLCLAGLLGITITGDAFNVFVFLEISSLATYTLIAQGKDRRALTASYQYLIMGTIGATFLLIGIGLMYMMTGTLNMADLAARLPEVEDTRTVHTAFAFVCVGVSLKLALFPLHLWLPNAYAYAPSAVTAFLAATSTKVAVYVLLRFVFTVFGPVFSFSTVPLQPILVALAIAGVLSASAVAIFQVNVKRLLAYSSVAQIGYMIMGISFASLTGLTGGILHLFNHALMKGALFLALGCIAFRVGSMQISNLAGIGKRMPWTMGAFIIAGLSLIGVPLTTGFVSKWYLILAALEQGWWPIAAVIVIASLMAVIYIWRVVEVAFFREPAGTVAEVREAPLFLLAPTWLLALSNLYFGIRTDLSVGLASSAAQQLLGVGP